MSRSDFEEDFQKHLKKNKIPFEYETEKLPYPVIKRPNYIPDFIFPKKKPKGSKMYIELKGRLTSADRQKMETVRKEYPHLDIRMLFQNNSYLTKLTKKQKEKKKKKIPFKKDRYGDWADKVGFKWAVYVTPLESKNRPEQWLPEEWLKEIKHVKNNKN